MKFIAHRGYSKCFPENSLPAFKAVIDHPFCKKSICGIEFDVHLTADGKIPVMHETSIADDNGTPVKVADCTFMELQRLFSIQHGELYPPVPDFDSVLGIINHKTDLCIEIKCGSYDLIRFSEIFISALSSYAPNNDVVISSFSYDILEYIRRHCTAFNIRYAYIFKSADALLSVPKGVRERFDLLHPWYKLLFTAPELFNNQTPIRCWTVNDHQTLHTLTDLSRTLPIEAIMTDDISMAEYADSANINA